MTRLSIRQCAYGAAVFLTSAGGLVLEIVAGRLLAPYVGMSLYTWTAIIAVVLAGFSIGHWIGGNLANEGCDRTAGARRVAVALALAAISSMASLVLLRWLSGPLLGAGWSPVAAIVALAAALFLAPSLFVGIVSPILTKLAVDDAAGRHGLAIGRMYALGALGSIVGTLAAGFLFISWVGSTGTVLAVATMYAALAIAFAIPGRTAGALVVVVVLLGGSFGYAGYRAKAFVSPCRVESDYYCIRIDNFAAESGRPSAIMVLDHLAHGINDRDDPSLLYSTYLHFLDELVRRLRPAGEPLEAFVIGGGALTLPRAWAHDQPTATIRVAEIDPAVTQVAAAYMWARPENGLEVVHGDGRVVLQALPPKRQFDVVLGDAFHDISIPAHLVTREFHREVRARLAPGGTYAVNVIEAGLQPRFLLSLVRTLAVDFTAVEVWVDAAERNTTTRITYVVIAGDVPTPFGSLRSMRGLGRTWLRLPTPELVMAIRAADVPILTDDYAPVDRLLAHVILDPELAER
jgi:spermidine synthase/MFS family permease